MLRGSGFLGTGASLGADLTLVVQLLFFLLLSVGVIAQLLRKYKVHDWIQTPVVVLNFFFIIFIMAASFLEQRVARTLVQRPTDLYYIAPFIHAGLGLLAQGLATYALLAGHKILPRKIGLLRYVMWTTYGAWILAVSFGIGTYVTWYLLDTGGEVVALTEIDFVSAEEGAPPVKRALLQDFAFQPQELTVVAGTTVVWVNQDGAPHNVTFADNSFGSDNFFQGEVFEMTFDEPGVYPVYCTLHGNPTSGMIGMVTVLEDTPENVAVAAAQPVAEAALVPPEPTLAPAVPLAPVSLIEPPEPGQTLVGLLAFRDHLAPSDSATVAMSGVEPPPDGSEFHAWLTGGGSALDLGRVTPDAQGALSFTYVDPFRFNLMGFYDGLQITLEPVDDPDPRPGQIVYSGRQAAEANAQIRLITAGAPDTPDGVGYGVGARLQAEEIIRHAQFMKLAADLGSIADAQRHAEHIVNVLEGENGAFFADHDGAHGLQNPGDGYGVIAYIEEIRAAASAAAGAPDATNAVQVHAGHTEIAMSNALATAEALREAALGVLRAEEIGAAGEMVALIGQLSDRLLLGEDLDGDGQIALAESGIFTAYQHAQYMGAVGIVAGDEAGVADPVSVGGEEVQLVGGEIVIDMYDFAYGLETVTIPAGSQVRFVNRGGAKHSATADDRSFDTGLLDPGQELVITFDEPGFYPYYCLLHGTQGGVGMAASITVVEAGSGEVPVQDAAPPAPTETLAAPTEAAAPTGPEPTQLPPTPAEAPSPTEAPAAAPLTFEIDMLDFTYSELSLEIPAGSTIVWTNAGDFKHSATADDGSWDTGLLDPNGVASITYDEPGVYPYYCTLHGAPGRVGMAGTVTVR